MNKSISILTTGSRGDVQPFLSLAVGLQEAGFRVRIAANAEFETFIRERGVDFSDIGANPNDALPLLESTDAKKFKKEEYIDLYTDWMRQWLVRGLEAGKDADVIMVAPVASICLWVAEKLAKPSMKLCYQPETPTREFPNPILRFRRDLGRYGNRLSYFAGEQVSWLLTRSVLNRLRREVLDLPKLPLVNPARHFRRKQIPVLYGISSYVVPKPDDWPEWNHITGYWFLETKDDWQPPQSLVDFLNDGAAPIFFELGSLTPMVRKTVRNVLLGLVAAGHRAIANHRDTDLSGIAMSDRIYLTDESVPHSWILPRVAAAIIHGGPSSIAAALKAGIPVQILPIFSGHHFWGKRVEQLGVGLPAVDAKKVTPRIIAESSKRLLGDRALQERAAELGRSIRSENGVANAVKVIKDQLSN